MKKKSISKLLSGVLVAAMAWTSGRMWRQQRQHSN